MKQKIYRLHITCPAGHTSYWDYKTLLAALNNYNKLQDKTTWYAERLEILDYAR